MRSFNNVFGSIVVATLAMVSCVSATVSDSSICDQKDVSFALPPEPPLLATACSNPAIQSWGGQLPDQSTTTDFDFSDPLKKITDVASNLQVQINQLLLDNTNNEFGFVSSVDVQAQGLDSQGNPNAAFPPVLLAQYTAADAGSNSELNVNVLLGSDTILSYLEGGKVRLTITLHSNSATLQQACALYAQSSVNTTVHMCVAVSASISKSL